MGNLITNALKRKMPHESGGRENKLAEEIMISDNTTLRGFESQPSNSEPFIFQGAMHLDGKGHRRYRKRNVQNQVPETRSFECHPTGPQRPQTPVNYMVYHHLLYHYQDSPRTAVYPINHSSPKWYEDNQLCVSLTEEPPVYPDLCPHTHQSSIHLAVTAGRHHSIPYLLNKGVNINGRTKSGQTALHLASKILNQQAINTLLLCGADINLTTPVTKETALHLAVWSSSCKAGILLAAGDKCVKLLLLHGADVHLKDWLGREAIHTACSNGRNDIINLLLDYDADVNSLTEMHESPLFLFLEKEVRLRQAEVLRRLLSLSYPLKITNYEGRLPGALNHPRHQPLKSTFMRAISEVLSLQDICKFNIRKIYTGKRKQWLKGFMPASLWRSIYVNEEFSYASKISNVS